MCCTGFCSFCTSLLDDICGGIRSETPAAPPNPAVIPPSLEALFTQAVRDQDIAAIRHLSHDPKFERIWSQIFRDRELNPLLFAAIKGHTLVVQELLQMPQAPHIILQKDMEGKGVLMHAVLSDRPDCVRAVLEAPSSGALCGQVNRFGYTPLMLAIIYRKDQSLGVLLSDPRVSPTFSMKDRHRSTAMAHAVQQQDEGAAHRVRSLLQAGVPTMPKEKRGNYTLSRAVLDVLEEHDQASAPPSALPALLPAAP